VDCNDCVDLPSARYRIQNRIDNIESAAVAERQIVEHTGYEAVAHVSCTEAVLLVDIVDVAQTQIANQLLTAVIERFAVGVGHQH